MDTIDVFIKFLEEQGVYDRVLELCDGRLLPMIVAEEELQDYLLCIFLFENTDEGFDFWIGVHGRWMDYLESK